MLDIDRGLRIVVFGGFFGTLLHRRTCAGDREAPDEQRKQREFREK